MPPLAHYLAPQIMARAREIEEQLGPPAPVQTAYLAQSDVHQKTPYDPRGVLPKGKGKTYDPRSPAGAMLEGLGIMQRSRDPIAQKVARAMGSAFVGRIGTKGGTRHGYLPPKLIPNAGVPARGEQIGMTETGEPIFAPAPAAPEPARTKKLQLKRGEVAGFDEKGESVDPRGQKLGYLATVEAPMGTVKTKHGDTPLRDLARRKKDITISSDKGTMMDTDAFGAAALKQLYGEHLKALQENFQDTGVEAYPSNYFDAMSPEQRKNIEIGVQALRAMERGEPT